VLTNRVARYGDRAIRRGYLQGIRRSTLSIDIASAYFLPGPIFLLAMRRAARRGVRVRVLLPARSDVWIVALATQSIVGRLLADGVEVYAYAPRILHSKTAVFDGRFTVIGSHNLDALSLSHNLECDVVVDSLEFGRVVLDVFEDDLTHAHRLDLASWRRRSMLLRVVAWLAALFRPLL
jgi:cardiolipin synthase